MKVKNWLSRHRLIAYNPAGNTIPMWAGIAYRDFSSDGYYYAPLGLHWLIRWTRSIWHFAQAGYMVETPFELGFAMGRQGRDSNEIAQAYKRGHEARRRHSNQIAWENGYSYYAAVELRPKINAVVTDAWGVIANVDEGNWAMQSTLWNEAAARWRDKYMDVNPPTGVDASSEPDVMPTVEGV